MTGARRHPRGVTGVRRWLSGAVALPLVLAGPVHAQDVRSHAERSGWMQLTPHDSVVAFYDALAAASPDVRVRVIGHSREGRSLLLATLAHPAIAEPWAAHASGKPIVFISAQVHGDEPGGKEGLMLFARDLALGPLRDLLDRVIFVFIPQVNPDGAEAGEWGTRANAAGYNINRDYLRLANPETRALVDAIAAWRPHILIDAHELTGPRVYDFYSLQPTTLNAPAAVVRAAGGPLTDAVRGAVEAAGFSWFPYHIQPSDPARVRQVGLQPAEYSARTLRGYGGEQGAITLLFESKRDRTSPDARVEIEPRARMHRVAMEAVGRFAADQAPVVLEAVRAAREAMRTAHATDSIVVRAAAVERTVVPYRMPGIRRRASGQGWETTGTEDTLQVAIRDTFRATLSRTRPAAYLIEPGRGDLAAALTLHGLAVERLMAPARVRVESFIVDSVAVEAEPYEGYLPRSVRTTTRAGMVDAPAGSFLVRTDQPNAAILFALLEPETEDSFATIGDLTTALAVGEALPIRRVMERPSVPTRLFQPH